MATEILTQPAHGRVSVNPNGKLCFVGTGSTFVGDTSFTYTVNGQTRTKDLTITASPQDIGWGTSELHYMLATDAQDRVIVEHGDNHRKVYVSPNGLTQADVDAGTGVVADYGDTEGTALEPGIGFTLWDDIQSASRSHWLLLERGHNYGSVPYLWFSGESEIHPTLIGAWGAGSKPEISERPSLLGGSSNLLIRDIYFSDGLRIVGDATNYIIENVDLSGRETVIQGFEGVHTGITLRNSIIRDTWREEPAGGATDWSDAKANRESGLYAAGTNGLLFEGLVFDHNGWAPDFDPNGASSGGHPPSQFSHDLYLQFSTTDVTLRKSLLMRGASYGAHFRGGAYAEDNVFLDNNIAFDTLGGDYENRGPIGHYSLLNGNLTTSAAGRGEDVPLIGATNWGTRNEALLTTLLDNIVAHDNDPNNAGDATNGINASYNKFGASGIFADDTIVWRWGGVDGDNNVREDNVGGLSTTTMNATTIQSYAASLSLPTATAPVFTGYTEQGIADFAQYLRTLDESEYAGAVLSLLSYFRAGFSVAETNRTTSATLRFVPDVRGDGVRWDNRLNWDSGDLPGTVAGDSVDLGGNRVVFGGTVTVDALTFGKFGGLIANHGRLDVTGALSVSEGCSLDIGNSGQVWLSGTFTGTDDFAVAVTSGRFANTATYDLPGAITVTGSWTQAILATAGGSFTVDSLTVDALSKVGFDDSATGTATLTCAATSTLTCLVDDATTFRPIGKFRSGAYGDDNSGLSTTAALDGTLIVDLAGYTGGAQTLTLIAVDTLTGSFASTQVNNVPAGLTASVSQNATTVDLVIT